MYLGNHVRVETKIKGATTKSIIEFSKAPKEWKVPITSIEVPDDEVAESYTKFIISNLNEAVCTHYNSDALRKELGNIYHYYIYGEYGVENPKKAKCKKVSISVDGVLIDTNVEDHHSLVCIHDVCLFTL